MKQSIPPTYDFIACETHTDISTRHGTAFGIPIGFGIRRPTIWEGSPSFIDIELDVDLKAGDGFTLLSFNDARAFCNHETVSRDCYRKYFGI